MTAQCKDSMKFSTGSTMIGDENIRETHSQIMQEVNTQPCQNQGLSPTFVKNPRIIKDIIF